MSKIKIAYALDDKYVFLTLVSMISVIENTKENIEFVILHSGLTDKSVEILNSIKKYKNCSINFIKLYEKLFRKTKLASWVTIQAQFRAMLPDIFPDDDKCIYLDCDTLLNGDISEFWNIDNSDCLIAAVSDVYSIKDKVERLKLKSDSYFNSGVMLINCKKCFEFKLLEKFIQCSSECPDIKYGDQDILNKIIDENKKIVSPRYNYMEVYWHNCYHEYTGEFKVEYEKAQKNPLIIHFTAWKPDNPKNHHSYKKLWWYYACKTDYISEHIGNYIIESNDYIKSLEDYINKFLKKIKIRKKSEFLQKDILKPPDIG